MIKKYIKRPQYIKKIQPFIDQNIIKVLVGQRRVGKSYLLFQIIDLIKEKHPQAQIIYINKEDYNFNWIRTAQDLIQHVEEELQPNHQKVYLLIDEIQDIDEFEKALRHFYTQEKYDIYCTGSNAHMLSSEIATYLSGRHLEIKIFGLNYTEFLTFHKLQNTTDSLKKYLKYGGLPALKDLPLDDVPVFEYLNNIYNTILFKDIIDRFKIRNSSFLQQLVLYLADNVGSLVSAKKISDFLKSQRIEISTNVVIDYLNHLSNAFFVFKTVRQEIAGKKIFEINNKYYFEDLGLRHSIIGYRPNDINKILENIVFIHLQSQGYKVFVGKLGTQEIDFICQKENQIKYIQVSYLLSNQKIIDREFGNLLKIKDNYPKYVISPDEIIGDNFQGIKHLNLRDFLTADF